MAITYNTPHNGKYFEVSGVYTGTYDKDFQVVIEDDDSFKWRSNDADDGWSSYTTNVTLTVGSELTLEYGVKIKFQLY